MCDVLRAEFKLKHFGLHHEKPECFVTPQWRWRPGFYLAYRILTAMYSTSCFLAVTLMSIGNKMNIMVFLTIWTYLVLCLYLIITAVITVVQYCQTCGEPENSLDTVAIEKSSSNGMKDSQTFGVVSTVFENDSKSEKELSNQENKAMNNSCQYSNNMESLNSDKMRMNWGMKASWFLASVVYVFGIVVTVVYFIALFPLIGVTKDFGNDLNMHAFNTVLILVDSVIVARPVRLLHTIYPTVYGLCYVIFSVIFWSQDKDTNVLYPGVLDWNYPGHTLMVIVILALVGIPLLQLAHFGLYRLRLKMYKSLYKEEFM